MGAGFFGLLTWIAAGQRYGHVKLAIPDSDIETLQFNPQVKVTTDNPGMQQYGVGRTTVKLEASTRGGQGRGYEPSSCTVAVSIVDREVPTVVCPSADDLVFPTDATKASTWRVLPSATWSDTNHAPACTHCPFLA